MWCVLRQTARRSAARGPCGAPSAPRWVCCRRTAAGRCACLARRACSFGVLTCALVLQLTPNVAQSETAPAPASGSCVLSSFHARDSECVAPRSALRAVSDAAHRACARDALQALRALLGRTSKTTGVRHAVAAAPLPASFAAAASDTLAALAVLSPVDPDAPRTQVRVFYSCNVIACALTPRDLRHPLGWWSLLAATLLRLPPSKLCCKVPPAATHCGCCGCTLTLLRSTTRSSALL